jgi:hypothetical protein
MTSCNCKNPPGGGGNCNPNQMAICRTVGGSCVVDCVDLSTTLRALIQRRGPGDPLVLENLVMIVGQRSDVARLSDPNFLTNFRRGIYLDRQNTEVARYQLPRFTAGGATTSAD